MFFKLALATRVSSMKKWWLPESSAIFSMGYRVQIILMVLLSTAIIACSTPQRHPNLAGLYNDLAQHEDSNRILSS
jgi:hypothetical protein